MAGRNFLFVPGPTNVPDRILRAMAVPMEDHRSSAFPALPHECLAGLRTVFKTESATPLIFPSSGTGCWEAALTNCLDPGSRVLAARFGQFSHLWIDMCRRLGLVVDVLEVEWGEGAPAERYRAALEADKAHTIKAVLVCRERDRYRSRERRGGGPSGDRRGQAPGASVRRLCQRPRKH